MRDSIRPPGNCKLPTPACPIPMSSPATQPRQSRCPASACPSAPAMTCSTTPSRCNSSTAIDSFCSPTAFPRRCGVMDVDPDRLKLFIDDSRQEFWPVDEDGNAIPLEPGGEFELGPDGPSVSIAGSELSNAEAVVATFAHEIAHFRLFEARAEADE